MNAVILFRPAMIVKEKDMVIIRIPGAPIVYGIVMDIDKDKDNVLLSVDYPVTTSDGTIFKNCVIPLTRFDSIEIIKEV